MELHQQSELAEKSEKFRFVPIKVLQFLSIDNLVVNSRQVAEG